MANGEHWRLQLAPVTDPRAAIAPATWTASSTRDAIVKTQPRVLHCIEGQAVKLVIRSNIPIVSFTMHQSHYHVLVATADGTIWEVYPPMDQLYVMKTIDLSAAQDSKLFKVVGTIPGVQAIFCVQHANLPVVVCTSYLSPTTLLYGNDFSSSLEVNELEGDQSTTLLALSGTDQVYQPLLSWLFPHTDVNSKIVLFQGDVDASLRFALVSRDKNELKIEQSKVFLRTQHAIHHIMTFASSSDGKIDSILVLGAKGGVSILTPPTAEHTTSPVESSVFAFRAPVKDIVYIPSISSFIYCYRGKIFVLKASDVMAQRKRTAQHADLRQLLDYFAAQLPLPSDCVALSWHASATSLYLLARSGRVTGIHSAALTEMLQSVFPSTSTVPSESSTQSRIKSTLERIGQISSESYDLRSRSSSLDDTLRRLHSALQVLAHFKTKGAVSIVGWHVKPTLVATGSFSHRNTVHLACQVRLHGCEKYIQDQPAWSFHINLRTRATNYANYVIPVEDQLWKESFQDIEILLDADMLLLETDGVLTMSCGLVFESDATATDAVRFELPIVVKHTIHLAQVSELMDEKAIKDTSTDARVDPSLTQWSLVASNAKNSVLTTALQDLSALPSSARMSITLPIYAPNGGNREDVDEAVVGIISQLIDADDEHVREFIHSSHGKVSVTFRSSHGHVLSLRGAFSGISSLPGLRPFQLTLQSGDQRQLASVRARLLVVLSALQDTGFLLSKERAAQLGVEIHPYKAELAQLETTVQNVTQCSLAHGDTVSSDELIRRVAAVAQVEIEAMQTYFRTRVLVNQLS